MKSLNLIEFISVLQLRKILVEKKRRERIDKCLKQIKDLLFQGTEFQVLLLLITFIFTFNFTILCLEI